MSDQRSWSEADQSSPGEAQLRAALRDALSERDRAIRQPVFAALWPSMGSAHTRNPSWKPTFAVATALVAVVLIGLSWTLIHTAGPDVASSEPNRSTLQSPLDATLARELSSPEYWRVPTDAVLAFAPRPLSAEMPLPDTFQISLEESLL